ncbi:Neuronal acetylcholine receptor subunit alpha-2 [Fasciola gigantica]|uniref:Neuronal acetylcholine receptor subunit alpha-2 n=1 Tax=Fasciola gigantica TaxID=46835 RepID=A0A504YNY9_FASGI|nr:Neuronal acetylcholine receptor subunit alpha-2 [Fasciola gigantica]
MMSTTIHEYDASVRSDRSRDRAHRRKKQREETRSDTAHNETSNHRSHRRRKENVESTEENASNYHTNDGEYAPRLANNDYPQPGESENYPERNESVTKAGGNHRHGERRSKHRSHRRYSSARESEYMNAPVSQAHDRYHQESNPAEYPYGHEETEEYVEEQTGYTPSVDENYPEHEGSVLSGSQIPNGSVSYQPEYDMRRRTNYSRSGSHLDPSAQSVSEFGDHSVHSGTPHTVGGGEPGYWHMDDERNISIPPVVTNDAGPECVSARPKPLQKFLSSFRRLKPKSLQRPEPQTTDSSGSLNARVIMLDGEEVSYPLDKNDLGLALFNKVCETLDLLETDYFGLTYVSNKLRTWFWLDMDKKISKQLRNDEQWIFSFQVRFYPPEPTLLQEDITRYLLTLQVRQDIYTGKLPCSWVTQALLGSFMVQAELGDYEERQFGGSTDYLNEFEFIPSPTPQLLQKIAELHKTHIGMKPNQADIKYLETAKRLELYGVDLHPVRDMENVDIYLGVGFHGIVIYRDRLRIGRFAWPKVLRISFKKNNFYLKIRPDNTEPVEAVIGFRLLNHYLANRLWKAAVEHHAFFRLKEARLPKGPSTPLNPTHTYTGRTFFQYRTMNISRPHPQFNRSLMKRRTSSMPTGLNKTGSMHTLSRAHPRDMTVGRTQETDGFGKRRSGSAQISLATTGHANSTGQLYNTVPRGSDFHDGRSQLSRMTNETGGPSISYASGARGSSASHSRPHDYVNYSKGQPEWYDKAESIVSGSVLTESNAHQSSVITRHSDRRTKDRRPLSPVYVNEPARSGLSGKETDTPSELDQASSAWRTSDQSSGRRQPPRGGVPALGGAMLSSQGSRNNQTVTPTPQSRHRQGHLQEDEEPEQLSDGMDDVNYYTSEESHTERHNSHVKNRPPRSPPNQISRRRHSNTELML